ncbi:MAG TPA: carboxypeptidase-like regulatory domain-containing protein, partial [Ottowia sp.]|uniref:carboxypeptidase-like regulatory domain-containing protein n=1 Tax=Ottowia sp. TaxID=1898956 RepID=UPI002D04B105
PYAPCRAFEDLHHLLGHELVKATLGALLAALAALLLAACGSSSSDAGGSVALRGRVTDASGTPVAGATVFAVPAKAVDTETPMRASAILSGAADGIDEPLEDAIDRAGASFPRAQTDDAGQFSLPAVRADASYFVHVTPASEEEVLPGGNLARRAQSGRELAAAPLEIRLSSRPPSDAGNRVQGLPGVPRSAGGLETHPARARRHGARRVECTAGSGARGGKLECRGLQGVSGRRRAHALFRGQLRHRWQGRRPR